MHANRPIESLERHLAEIVERDGLALAQLRDDVRYQDLIRLRMGAQPCRQLNRRSEQIAMARSWGAYGTGPVAIPFMWNAIGRAAGSVFIGEKTSQVAAAEFHDLISRELARNQKK